MTRTRRWRLALSGACVLTMLTGQTVTAEEDPARDLLRAMTDYISKQQNLSVKYDSDVEVVTPSLEKIQFSASGEVELSRPGKFRASRTGGYANLEIISDGSTIVLHDLDEKQFAEVKSEGGGFDEMVDRLRAENMIEIPGADLLLSNAFEELSAGVIEGRVIGSGVVDGTLCDHLAFRNDGTDWQIWIESGERPLPRKYVITSKTVASAPQYSLRLHDWKTGEAARAEDFKFSPSSDARRVDVVALHLDEVPTPADEEPTK